jgi:hypothetical protein
MAAFVEETPSALNNEDEEFVLSPSDVNRLLIVLEAIKHVNATQDIDEYVRFSFIECYTSSFRAISFIVHETCNILGCDRATLFMVQNNCIPFKLSNIF